MNYWRCLLRYRLKIFSLIIVFLIFSIYKIFEISIKTRKSSLKIGFTNADIQYEFDKYVRLKNEYQLTGIILHWQRLNGVRNLVQTMLEYKDLFSYIIIWNNNPTKNLTFEDLSIEKHIHIKIINSNVNIKDQAKYRVCELATTKACFYADDDWNINTYTKSLYSSFLLEPTIVHSITDQYTYFTNLMWTFFDPTIDLHTGFSWIGCGSIFSRDNAVQHLRYMNFFLNNDANRDLISQGDQFFSLWMNQIPAQLNGRLFHSIEGARSSFENSDFKTLQYKASILAIKILEKSLRSKATSNLFQRQRSTNTLATYTKSPCSYNDGFIFFTNCIPIDNLEKIPFNITINFQRGTRENLPHLAQSPYPENVKFFETYSTANAVDNDIRTCWKINRSIRAGDLYGIDFQMVQINRQFSFSIQYFHGMSLQKKLQISVSLNGETWIEIDERAQEGIIYQDDGLVDFHARLFPNGFQTFRFIKFVALKDYEISFHICEVRLLY